MPSFTPTTWVDDSEPAISATQLNRMETGIDAAIDAAVEAATVTEAWDLLTIGADATWTDVALAAFGVADGDLVWIVMFTKASAVAGARADGSAIARLTTNFGGLQDYSSTTSRSWRRARRQLWSYTPPRTRTWPPTWRGTCI